MFCFFISVIVTRERSFWLGHYKGYLYLAFIFTTFGPQKSSLLRSLLTHDALQKCVQDHESVDQSEIKGLNSLEKVGFICSFGEG
ncbi:hypothetical protein HanPSC8_Chr11g0454711 [Helianthus annuus]|nr:hypothetical protein HanPSC8_Chr11g0454711 [Helianthus annuus]